MTAETWIRTQVRMPANLMRRIKAQVKKDRRSQNHTIIYILESHFRMMDGDAERLTKVQEMGKEMP